MHRVLLRHHLPGVPGAVRRCGGDVRWGVTTTPDAGRLARVREAARPQGPGVRAGRRRRHAGRAGREKPVRCRTRRTGRACRRQPGDCIFFSAGPPKASRALLGAARVEIAHRLNLIDPNAWAFTWVVDFPLFEPADEATAAGDVALGSGAWTAVHHAFTSPKRDRKPPSTAIRAMRSPTPTTSSATATRSAAARSVSTVAIFRNACSR